MSLVDVIAVFLFLLSSCCFGALVILHHKNSQEKKENQAYVVSLTTGKPLNFRQFNFEISKNGDVYIYNSYLSMSIYFNGIEVRGQKSVLIGNKSYLLNKEYELIHGQDTQRIIFK